LVNYHFWHGFWRWTNFLFFGLGFLINLGLGIGLGYLLPLALQHPEKIVTPFGLITISGVAIAIFGLVLANKAGQLRNHEQNTLKGLVENEAKKVNQYKIGMILAIASGFSTGTQNLAFSFTFSMQDMALQMGSSPFGASTILWPLYLTCSLVPTSLFYLYLHKKNKSFSCYLQPQKFKYFFLTFFMAVLWYGPVMLYSLGAKTLGNLGPLIGWPMYLILVILASNFWGWKHKEWENCSSKAKKIMLNSLCILIIAIVVLACGQFFT
jgi:L-rhamnose-H+ transport protein